MDLSVSKKLDKVLMEINKKYNCVVDAQERFIDKIPLSSPKLNYLTGGGVARGRIHVLLGAESGGKTVLASYIAGQVQKRTDIPNTVVFFDFERTFDPKYAEVVGLDISPKKFVYVKPVNGEDGFTVLDTLLSTGEIGCVIWDSVATTPSKKTFEKRVGEANYGATASLMSEGLKYINPKINDSNVVALFLNQVRAKIGGFMGNIPQENTKVGGYSLPFYSSWSAKVTKSEIITSGNDAIGMAMKIKNTKSKICVPFRSGVLNLFYNSGFDVDAEYIEFFSSLGLVQQKGAWFVNEEYNLKAQGKAEFSKWLLENPDKQKLMEEEVNKVFASQTIISAMEQEDEFFNVKDEEEVNSNFED